MREEERRREGEGPFLLPDAAVCSEGIAVKLAEGGGGRRLGLNNGRPLRRPRDIDKVQRNEGYTDCSSDCFNCLYVSGLLH